MAFETIDNRREPQTEEFEKLEFLSEQPAPESSTAEGDSGTIIFDPTAETAEEPPVSFDPEAGSASRDETGIDFPHALVDDLDFDAATPFELFGTSLFADDRLEDDEFAAIDSGDEDDDLVF